MTAKMAGRARRLPKWQDSRGTCQNGKEANFVKESQNP